MILEKLKSKKVFVAMMPQPAVGDAGEIRAKVDFYMVAFAQTAAAVSSEKLLANIDKRSKSRRACVVSRL